MQPRIYRLYGYGASTVTWDGNGGTPSRAKDENVMPYAKVASAPTATRTGYSLQGWYTAATGGTKACDAGRESPQIAKATTYYARWEGVPVTLTWDSCGGSKVTATTHFFHDYLDVDISH